MICYRDMTFCSAACKNTACRRNITPEVTEAATKWWGGDDFTIAVSDFSERCSEYQPKEGDDGNNGAGDNPAG